MELWEAGKNDCRIADEVGCTPSAIGNGDAKTDFQGTPREGGSGELFLGEKKKNHFCKGGLIVGILFRGFRKQADGPDGVTINSPLEGP